MKNTKQQIYAIFDKLHKNMTREEIIEVLYDFAMLKLKTSTFKKPIKTIDLIIGLDLAVEKHSDYPRHEFTLPFAHNNEVYIPENCIEKAIETDNIGDLIRTLGHELEHVYQVYNDIKDEVNYNTYYYYQIPDNVVEHLYKNFGEDALSLIHNYTFHMIANHYFNHYYHSRIESAANTMGTLYYGLHLKYYAKTVDDVERKEWLEKQVDNIFMAQERQREEIKEVESDIRKIDPKLMQIGLLSTLYFADNSPEFRDLILMNYDIALEFGLSKEFQEQYSTYYNIKFCCNNQELKHINNVNMRDNLLELMQDYDLKSSPIYPNKELETE